MPASDTIKNPVTQYITLAITVLSLWFFITDYVDKKTANSATKEDIQNLSRQFQDRYERAEERELIYRRFYETQIDEVTAKTDSQHEKINEILNKVTRIEETIKHINTYGKS